MREQPKRRYRICHTCGLRWNVSSLVPGQKQYVCPGCSKQRKEETPTESIICPTCGRTSHSEAKLKDNTSKLCPYCGIRLDIEKTAPDVSDRKAVNEK